MAQLHPTFTQALRTPLPDSSDSDDVVLALETARALETRGDVLEAAKWLRRAAEEAERQGNDARVLLFAHVAADLTSSLPHPASAPAPAPERRSEAFDSSEPTMRDLDLAATVALAKSHAHGDPDSSLPTIADDESSIPTMVPQGPAASPQPQRPPNTSPSLSIVCQLSISPDQPFSESLMHVGAIRVAIRRIPGAKSFSVEELDARQQLPAGTIEGMLVVAHSVDDSQETPTEQSGERPAPKR